VASTRPDHVRSGVSRSALVVGGTGPTGPIVVQGLLERGYETTIFHGGQHEVALPGEVRHLHGDPHFPETICTALGTAEFDVVVLQYGRLVHLANHLRGRAGHVVAIGGAMSPLAGPKDPRWGALGRPAVVREEERHLVSSATDGKLGFRIAEAASAFLAAGEAGDFAATYIAYSSLFGPRQPGSSEWAIVRRLIDARRQIVVPDGGLRLDSRAYVGNVAHAPLLAIDNPQRSAGRSYVVSDRDVYTARQRIEFICHYLGREIELVDMPYEIATPAHAFYRIGAEHRVTRGDDIREQLGYRDHFKPAEALGETVDWLLAASAAETAEIEIQLGDKFDYPFEDELIAWWTSVRATAPRQSGERYGYSHVYRHPTRPDDSWRRA